MVQIERRDISEALVLFTRSLPNISLHPPPHLSVQASELRASHAAHAAHAKMGSPQAASQPHEGLGSGSDLDSLNQGSSDQRLPEQGLPDQGLPNQEAGKKTATLLNTYTAESHSHITAPLPAEPHMAVDPAYDPAWDISPHAAVPPFHSPEWGSPGDAVMQQAAHPQARCDRVTSQNSFGDF